MPSLANASETGLSSSYSLHGDGVSMPVTISITSLSIGILSVSPSKWLSINSFFVFWLAVHYEKTNSKRVKLYKLMKFFGLTKNFYMAGFSQLPSDCGLQRFIIKIRINEVNYLLMNRDQNILRINEEFGLTRFGLTRLTMYLQF